MDPFCAHVVGGRGGAEYGPGGDLVRTWGLGPFGENCFISTSVWKSRVEEMKTGGGGRAATTLLRLSCDGEDRKTRQLVERVVCRGFCFSF